MTNFWLIQKKKNKKNTFSEYWQRRHGPDDKHLKVAFHCFSSIPTKLLPPVPSFPPVSAFVHEADSTTKINKKSPKIHEPEENSQDLISSTNTPSLPPWPWSYNFLEKHIQDPITSQFPLLDTNQTHLIYYDPIIVLEFFYKILNINLSI